MDDMTKHLIKRCAIKNDDLRAALPVNGTTSQLVYLKSAEKISYTNREFYTVKLYCGAFRISPAVVWSQNLWTILKTVRDFSKFNEDNDPFGERNFGNFKIDSETYYFKIDYWEDESMKWGAQNYLRDASWRVVTIYNSKEH